MRSIDVGVRDVVALLNTIAGVHTRASCEGTSRARSVHRHADLAYVLLRYPMPLALQDFFFVRLDAIARIEADGVYSRWPAGNREFLTQLAAAVRAYQAHYGAARAALHVPLGKLRASLAHRVRQGEPARLSWCWTCTDVVIAPHPDTHAVVRLLHLPAEQAARWFADFVARPANRLAPQLVEQEGVARLVVRTQRGDFGPAFQRRWLRYRSRRLAELTTHQLRLAVETARRHGSPVDFYFDDARAHFAWDSRRIGEVEDGDDRRKSRRLAAPS